MTTTSDAEKAVADHTEPEVRTSARLVDRLRPLKVAAQAPSRAVLAISALLTIISWHLPAFDPTQPKGDYDYGLAIAVAKQLGLSFGDRVSTTYGPLYFLAIPSVINRFEIAVGFTVWFVFMTGCLTALHQALRHHLSTGWAWTLCTAVALSFSITPLTAVITATTALVVVLAVFYVRAELPRWADRSFPIVMGLLVAALLLTKFSVGLMCGPVVLGAVLARRGRPLRAFLECAVAGVLGLAMFWIIAGQPVLQLVDYVVRALSVGSGHAQSMGLESADKVWEYVVALGLLLVLTVAVLTTKLAGGRRWLLWIGLACSMWLLFKQGFVRHDSHSAQFFCVVFVLTAVLAAIRRSAVVAAASLVSLMVQAVSFGGGLWAIDPGRSVQQLAEGVTVILSGNHQNNVLATSRAELQQRIGLPERFITKIGTASVRVENFDYGMAWAYQLTPAIPPTLLNYGAYTQLLDEMDQKWIADDGQAPEYIVREDSRNTLDYRFSLWDPPRTQLEQACRYQLADTSPKWKLLHRVANRCGAEHALGEVTVIAGQTVDVPQVSSGIVVAKVQVDESLTEKIKALAFRSRELWLTVDGEAHRLPESHQKAPLMLAAPHDQSLMLGGKELAAKKLYMNAPGRVVFSVVDTK